MITSEETTVNTTQNVKLYSANTISFATFLGGPLAAGYLIGENYKALNKPEYGRIALGIGILTTILLFGGLFMLPEAVIDKLPSQLIPIIYTGIVWGLIEWKQGDILKAHKQNNNTFFSGWRAAGIGLIALVIISIGIIAYAFLINDTEIYEAYDVEMEQFSINENETLVFYDNLQTKTDYALLKELDEITIPKWKENIDIINKTNTLEDLPTELVEQNKILLKYSELRVAAFQLFRKAIKEDSENYTQQLEQIHKKIDAQLIKLNAIQ